MSNKENLENKSIEIEAIRAGIETDCATMLAKLGELDDLIALVDEPEPCVGGPALELRSSSCPTSVTTNYYPYEMHYHDGFLYVSTIGANAGGSGNASLFKINPKTGSLVATYNAGSNASGNGLLGFCIEGGKAYVAHNKFSAGTTGIDIVDLATMTLDANVNLGTGASRNCVSDGTNIYAATTALKLKKFDIATRTVSDIYTFAASSDPFRSAFFDGKIWVCLFGNHANGNAVQVFDTSGSLLSTISTGAASQPNWFGQTDTRLFVACYGTHKTYEIASGSLGTTYTCPAADYPHIPFPVMDKQLWVGGTAVPTSYIRVFDIDTGSLITSLAKGPNIPSMVFDGGNVWNISANGNYIQRTVLDLVNT